MHKRRSAAWAAATAFALVGGPALARRWRRLRGDHRVAILEYHEVGPSGTEREGVVSETSFRRHLRYIKRHYRVVSLSEAVALLTTPGKLREDVVAVTLDDGYQGNCQYAWPILREENVPATVFLCTGFLDGRELWVDLAQRCFDAASNRYIGPSDLDDAELRAATLAWSESRGRARVRHWLKSLPPERRDALLSKLRPLCEPLAARAVPLRWEQVREMQSAGVEIGCHTVSHPILSSLPARRQWEEIAGARDRITAEIGSPPRFFAYPNGDTEDFTGETVAIVRNAAFVAACTTRRVSNSIGCDPFLLGRIGVGNDRCVILAARLAGLFDEKVRARIARYWSGVQAARAAALTFR